ncbi:integrase/recombinase XerD [Natranaerovirga pectinivora]|uniref:Integrase/recombinase XerD n=1 Tax=Natranaerovirga pectinivora TaxID=682400 RepID=A0A4R3MN38_9FIRM|nr:site-specific integrase [Natranaerovirga pectinivora]TCT15685.1 integrase/recombinase XerD [Natranaerovirga pectinivora]
MENKTKEPTIKRRKNLLISKVANINYDDLYFLYASDCKLRNISDITIKGYEFAHKKFKQFTGEGLKCEDISQDLINEYILYLKDKLKPQTVNSYLFKISPIIKFGIRKGYIKDTIEFTHLVEQEHFKEIYTTRELELLLKKPEGNSFAQYRTWVIINLLLATGIRAKELRELQIQDVNLDNAILSLNHTKNRKPRAIPIPTSLLIVLKEYLRIRNGVGEEPLFCNIYGEPLPRTTLQISVVKYCRARGVEKTSLHLFRHTFITLSVRKGMSPILLKRITGHSNLKMLNRYYNFDISDLVNIVDEYNPLEDFRVKKSMKLTKK